MQTFDITPLFRTSQSFDRVWDGFNTAIGFDHRGYPEYDLLKTGENEFRITLAVPGYQLDEITVETRDQALWVKGQKNVDPNHNQYLYQGIRDRQFERSFQLPDHVKVTGARLDAGMLSIELRREIPEALQPKKIQIETVSAPARLETSKAA